MIQAVALVWRFGFSLWGKCRKSVTIFVVEFFSDYVLVKDSLSVLSASSSYVEANILKVVVEDI